MNTHFTYFVILAASLAGPLVLSFDKKVAFYKKWKYVFPAMILPAIFYVAWDVFFTAKEVWTFNENYITGIKLANLPIEEVLFFFVVPYSCLFIYECINSYFPAINNNNYGDIILKLLAALLLITGIIFYKKDYTVSTFLLTTSLIGLIYLFRKHFASFSGSLFIFSYAVILIPFLIVNGYLTAIPVVQYNNTENLGIRIFSIPFEDIFYGMLLILMNVIIYEKLKSRKL